MTRTHVFPSTHLEIDAELVGKPSLLLEDQAVVELSTIPRMAADGHGLVHGGFVFGALDYAAMLAINHPNVVLGSAETRFVAPVRVGDLVRVEARVRDRAGKKLMVDARAAVGERTVLEGTLTCFVLDTHVLTESAQKEEKA